MIKKLDAYISVVTSPIMFILMIILFTMVPISQKGNILMAMVLWCTLAVKKMYQKGFKNWSSEWGRINYISILIGFSMGAFVGPGTAIFLGLVFGTVLNND